MHKNPATTRVADSAPRVAAAADTSVLADSLLSEFRANHVMVTDAAASAHQAKQGAQNPLQEKAAPDDDPLADIGICMKYGVCVHKGDGLLMWMFRNRLILCI